MRTILHALLPFVLLIAAVPALAEIGTIDNVPAATLLLPYFEVGITDPNTANTVMTVTNASATAVIAHFTLWTDMGLPTWSFDTYLTGYDTVTVDLRLVFEGVMPRTADDAQDPADTISPQGMLSQDINFPGEFGPCAYPAPAGPPLVRVSGSILDRLRKAHMGISQRGDVPWGWSYDGKCGAVNYGDGIARGYVTVDVVNQCHMEYNNPRFPGYGAWTATWQNVLFGDYVVYERAQKLAYGDSLVPIEAAGSHPEVSAPGQYTFYGAINAFDASDRREPLGSQWRARYSDASSWIVVWRDPGAALPWNCWDAVPTLGATEIVAFDEQENAVDLETTAFPYVANKVLASDIAPYTSGILHLDLNWPMAAGPLENPPARQSFVTVVRKTPGHFGSARSAWPIASATRPAPGQLIP